MSWLSYWKPSLTVLLVLFKVKKSKLLRCYITYLTILFGNFTSSWDLLISLCLSNMTTEVYTPITKSCSDDAGISPFLSVSFVFPGSLSLSLSPCLYLSRRQVPSCQASQTALLKLIHSTGLCSISNPARLIVWCQVVHSSYVVQSCCCLAFLELSLTSELSSLLGLRFSSSTCQFANWQVVELCPAFHFPFSLSKDRPSHSLLHSTPTGHPCSPLPSAAAALCSILCQPATLMHSPSSGWWGSGAQIQIRAMFAKLQRPCFPVMLRAFGLCFWFSFHSSLFLDSSVDIYC